MPKCEAEHGHPCKRGIENAFHERTFIKLFKEKGEFIALIKRLYYRKAKLKETLVNVEVEKAAMCRALCEQGVRGDFGVFEGMWSEPTFCIEDENEVWTRQKFAILIL